MKRKHIFIIISLMLMVLLLLCSCGAASPSSSKETVEITAENFKDYFEVKAVTDYINVNKKGGYTVVGVYIPESFSADAAFTVKIYPIKSFDIDSVSVELNVFDAGRYFDIDEYTTVNVSAVGETSTRQFTTSTKKDFYNEHFFDNLTFVAVVEEASGTITINK